MYCQEFDDVWKASRISLDALKHSTFVKPHCNFTPKFEPLLSCEKNNKCNK